MTPESAALLDAMVPSPGAVTTDHTDAIYQMIEPLHAVIDDMDAHLQALDKLRRAADRTEEDPVVYGWFERIKQSIVAGRQKTTDAQRILEELSDLCFQLDRYASEMRETTTRKTAQRDTVTMTRAAHDALVAKAAQGRTS